MSDHGTNASLNLDVLQVLRDLLTTREKTAVAAVLILTLVNSALEIIALAALIPLTNEIVGGADRPLSFVEALIPKHLAGSDRLIAIIVVVLCAYVIKNSFNLVLTYAHQRLGAGIVRRLTQRLFTTYMRRPYSFHLRNNSAVLIRNVQENAASLLSYVISPVITIATDVSVAIAMLGFLVVLEPIGTGVTVSVFCAGTILMLRLTRPLTDRWGAIRNAARAGAMKALLQGLGGVKEIKASGSERSFLDEHKIQQSAAFRATYLFAVMQQVPRAIFELLAVTGIGALVSTILLTDRPLSEAVGVLAIFAAAAFRMLPSFTRITSSIQAVSYGRASVHSVYEDLRENPDLIHAEPHPSLTKFQSLELRNVSFSYEGSELSALRNLTLTVKAGEYLGIIGPSGSGKTTLIDLLLGLFEPATGDVYVNGLPMKEHLSAWQQTVGYVPQEIYLLDDSIRRNVALDIRDNNIDDVAVEEALRASQLWDFVESLHQGWESEVGERGVRLSGGQRQRLGIARALYRRPQVLLFDEATSALDNQTESEVVESIEQLRGSRTVIIVAHRLSTVRKCDRLYLLDSGRVVKTGHFGEVVGTDSPLA